MPYADVKLAVGERDQVWIAFEDRRKEGDERVVLTKIKPKNDKVQAWSWVGHAPDIAVHGKSILVLLNDDQSVVQVLQADSQLP